MKVALAVLLVALLAWKVESASKWCFDPTLPAPAAPKECAETDLFCKYTANGPNALTVACDNTAGGTAAPIPAGDVNAKCAPPPTGTFTDVLITPVGDADKDKVTGETPTAPDFLTIKDCIEKRKDTTTLTTGGKFCFDPTAATVAKQCPTAGTDNCKYSGKTDDPATQILECVASGPTGIEDCKDKTIVVTAAGAPTAAGALAATGSSKKFFEDCEMKAKTPPAPMPTTTAATTGGDGGGVSSIKSSVLLLFVTSVLGAAAKSFL